MRTYERVYENFNLWRQLKEVYGLHMCLMIVMYLLYDLTPNTAPPLLSLPQEMQLEHERRAFC